MKRCDERGDSKSESEFTACEECSMGFCDECEHIDNSGEDDTEREYVEIGKAVGSHTK